MSRLSANTLVPALPLAASALLLAVLVQVWAGRLLYPFDLEWMEGGMLAHAWRLQQGLPLYVPPTADFVPFIYPPGYSAVVAVAGLPTGLTPAIGRAVSLAAILGAAGAATTVLRRGGAPWWVALAGAVAFLGTYPQTGAFYDLVRPDSLGLALMAWAVVLAFERGRWAPLGAGVLLALAVLVKHNLGAVAVPIGLALALRSWRDALAFVVALSAPLGLGLGALQVASSGAFLTYLLEVPLSHDVRWQGGLLDSVREWGMAMPVPLLAGGLAMVVLAVRRQGSVPVWASASGPIWAGMALAWWLTYVPPDAGAAVLNVTAGFAAWALGAGAVALLVWVAGGVLDAVSGSVAVPSWRTVLGVGLAATTAGLAWWMRAHQGGFVNVHIPFVWVASVGFGFGLARMCSGPAGAAWLASGAMAAQLTWSLLHLHPSQLVPTAADEAAGWRIVDSLRGTRGPVLSPFASWLPVYVGQPPSLHVMGVWDVDHLDGPYQAELVSLDQALREHRWELVVGGSQAFRPVLPRYYEVAEPLFEGGDPALLPRTGWMARPERLLVPRDVPVP